MEYHEQTSHFGGFCGRSRADDVPWTLERTIAKWHGRTPPFSAFGEPMASSIE